MEAEDYEMREQKRRELDRLSLELLSNTTHYKKYLAKIDPEAQTRSKSDVIRLSKNRGKVDELLTELLDDYGDLGTASNVANTNIQRLFKECVDKLLQFVEWRDCMDTSEPDMLFEEPVEEPQFPTSSPTESFWGKRVNRRSSFR